MSIYEISDIIIGTTALNRPILHKDTLSNWLKWISQLNEEIKLQWFINIDIIEGLPFTYEETEKNIQEILIEYKLNDRINVVFLKSTEKSNFLNACKRISTSIIKYVFDEKLSSKNIRIIWLEDDWKLNDKIIEQININYLIKTLSIHRTHINFSFIRNNYIWALAPSIIDYELWIDIFYKAWICQISHIDPEHCAGVYYTKMYEKEEVINNITVIWRKETPKYLSRTFINYPKSLYMIIDEKENCELLNNKKYISKEKFKRNFGNKNTFIRITPSFCVDGCNYGREFMKKYELEKSRIQNDNNTYFYK
jgi:hypothetical protein